jgi:hypothetical protein
MSKPMGKRGSWFADWKGESLPCVHQCWVESPGQKRMTYCDPGLSDDPKWSPFVATLQAGGKAILTEDSLRQDGFPADRLGYVALYEIANVSTATGELRFDFVRRLENFS